MNYTVLPKPKIFDVDLKISNTFKPNFSVVGELGNDLANNFSELFSKAGFSSEGETTVYVKPNPDLSYEEYTLDISDTIVINGGSERACYYGLCSLVQILFSRYNESLIKLPKIHVCDSPRFEYRAFMLDVARHFFPVEVIKRLVDVISLLKFNTLHLHLTDDQGWRIESKLYPDLTSKGSCRSHTLNDKKEVKGFYTQQQIKEIVEYCASKYIEVIPEVDLPGHFIAGISAYNELSCKKEPIGVATAFGIHETILCGGSAKTYDFLQNLLNEIADLFPCKYFHLGGDEAPKTQWELCEVCQTFMKEKGLKTEEQLQAYLTNFAIELLSKKGKTAIVWNESLYSGMLDERAVCQYWNDGKNPQRVIDACNLGRKTIISKFKPMYLDYPHAMHSLKELYCFEPIIAGITQPSSIIGVESPLWTEYVATKDKINRQCFPRLLATSELGWCVGQKDYDDFALRVSFINVYLARFGILGTSLKNANPGLMGKISQMLAFVKPLLNIPSIKGLARGAKAQKKVIAARKLKEGK